MTRTYGAFPLCLATISFLIVPVVFVFAQTPALPIIPANSFNITNYDAVGDGLTTNTTAIQNTINAAFAAGGGTVEIPSGVFLSGPLNFSNSINLQLDSGATLRMLPYGSYPGGSSPADFITSASSGHDLEVSGAGTIDGQAENSGWWTNNLPTSERPTLFYFNKCDRVLIENVTLENPPSMHIVFKNGGANITIQGMTINTPGNSPNTDGIDLVGTNCLVQNCSISDGDDCIALGSTGGTCSGILVTNCAFGFGHGLSIGGNTLAGVSNLTVVNCSFNGTEYGIRLKSDNAGNSPGAGGVTQNLFYSNLAMTNIVEAPIVIYSYYNEIGTPILFSPTNAAGQPIPASVPTTTCVWRNILISNLTATVDFGGMAGVIWGRTEMPATNVILNDVKISAPATFDVYNAYGFQFINSQITLPAASNTFTIFNAGMILSNDTGNATLSGLTSTNWLALYNASASTTATDLFGADPITVSAGTLAVNNSYTPVNAEAFDFALGTNASTVTAGANVIFNNATINVTNAAGFGAGLYTLFTYAGSASGTYALGSAPANYNYLFDTNTAGKIQLVVSPLGMSEAPVSLVCSNSGGQLALSWPQDHTGWFLEIQTNAVTKGLSTNWTLLTGSAMTNQYYLPISPANGSVFLRLYYP
jgi:polygalacturonase